MQNERDATQMGVRIFEDLEKLCPTTNMKFRWNTAPAPIRRMVSMNQ
jgi:hypothetical protein